MKVSYAGGFDARRAAAVVVSLPADVGAGAGRLRIPSANTMISSTAAAITSARGSRMPNRRSSEKRPGPVSVIATAEAMLATDSSGPPDEDEKGFRTQALEALIMGTSRP